MRKPITITLAVALVLGIAALAAAAQPVERGVDLFTTPAGGSFYDFSANPIPAGFFCDDSPAFDGRINLRGLPLVTRVPGQLRGADTVVERLDDAVFNAQGVAHTRVQVRALSLVGTEPVVTPCGSFQVYVTAAGKQNQTTMEIVRTAENGGVFRAPVDVLGRMTFVPIENRFGRPLVLEGSFSFPAGDVPWSYSAGSELKQVESAVVDTDGDQIPDTLIGGVSNFAPGWPPEGLPNIDTCRLCEPEICHTEPEKTHCSGPVYACTPSVCP